VIAAVRQPDLGVLASRETHRPNRRVPTRLIVRHGHAEVRSLRDQMTKDRGLQGVATTVIARHRDRSVIRRRITTTAAIRSRHAPTILRPHVRPQSRGLILLLAAATRLRRGTTPRRHRHARTPRRHRHARTPRQAIRAAAVVAAIAVAGAAPARTAGAAAVLMAEAALLLTAGHKVLRSSRALPDLSGGLFFLMPSVGVFFPSAHFVEIFRFASSVFLSGPSSAEGSGSQTDPLPDSSLKLISRNSLRS